MTPVRLTLVCAVALAGCEVDVVLGQYLSLNSTSDAGDTDAGGADADGGGALDGGTGDAGTTNDGGAVDGGATDGGVSDGGADAGAGPNIVLRFVGDYLADIDAGSFPLQFEVQNVGDTGVAPVSLTLVAPAGVEFLSFPSCAVDAGVASCSGPSLAAGATTSFTAQVRFPLTPRWVDLRATVTTATTEVRVDDNSIVQPLAMAPSGAAPLPVTPLQLLDLTYCVGSGLFTFAQCVPGSRIMDTLALAPGGQLGGVLADGGITFVGVRSGFWLQSSDARLFGFRLRYPDGGPAAGYIGGSVSASCFEGTATNGAQQHNGIAWQGCLR